MKGFGLAILISSKISVCQAKPYTPFGIGNNPAKQRATGLMEIPPRL